MSRESRVVQETETVPSKPSHQPSQNTRVMSFQYSRMTFKSFLSENFEFSMIGQHYKSKSARCIADPPLCIWWYQNMRELTGMNIRIAQSS